MVFFISNGFHFVLQPFDHSRSLQTPVQNESVVMIISSTLAQYSEGVEKFGISAPCREGRNHDNLFVHILGESMTS